ncbi:MAG TPA: hypothetical protein VFB25_01605 [Gaiellaceae bacterium]|nr:hypothetical protein [Gaiellaceae bacterium]
MTRRLNLLALLVAGAVTVLAVAGLSSAASNAAPTNQTAPTISGTAQEGDTLTASSGSWNGTTPITYAYQWRRCDKSGAGCSNIGGADSSTYLLKHADVGDTVRVRVTAKNSSGSSQATSDPTEVVAAKATAPTSTGCPSGTGPINVTQVTQPAQLQIDGQSASPSPITPASQDVTLRFHVSACGGRSVAGALVLAEAIPFQQFSVPPEVATGTDGWATITMHQAGSFPASPRQQILAVFVRARKASDPVLGGIAARRLVSFPVRH